ncbi:MAG: M15 family metallopeptidase, partial [Polyangiaceae bacterium]
ALAVVASGAACAASAPTPVTASSPSPLPSSAPSASSLAAGAPVASPNAVEPPPAATVAPPAVEPKAPEVSEAASASACNDQAPQDFLIRGNFLKDPKGNERAIQYRTDQYGYFEGFGHPAPGAHPPKDFLVDTTFMGLKVKMHRKVAPALGCVEAEIQRTCSDHPYKAHALAGIRYRNTYRGGEVTNHAYGIAIDVDPDLNTCCGCVPPWNDAPRCKRPAKTEYDRMVMPECWVHAFERFGFYWLGHDVLRDTMHFEFLGDPDKIVATPAPAVATP